jgi:hypothetical protein
MLNNFQMLELAPKMGIPLKGVYFKDELKADDLEVGKSYVINLSDEKDEDGDQNMGTHWVALHIGKLDGKIANFSDLSDNTILKITWSATVYMSGYGDDSVGFSINWGTDDETDNILIRSGLKLDESNVQRRSSSGNIYRTINGLPLIWTGKKGDLQDLDIVDGYESSFTVTAADLENWGGSSNDNDDRFHVTNISVSVEIYPQ